VTGLAIAVTLLLGSIVLAGHFGGGCVVSGVLFLK